MEYLTTLFFSTESAWLAAVLLGFMTAISPCPMATNLTAVGFISKDIEHKNRILFNGIAYTLGRAIGYTGLAVILYYGLIQVDLKDFFERYADKIIGPILIFIGLVMLDVLPFKLPGVNAFTSKLEQKNTWNYIDVILLGVIYSLAFCPYSGVLYFTILIPLTIDNGLHLPVLFAIATGIPVIIFSWILAFAVSKLAHVYNKVKLFELWMRRVVSVLFIVIGLYELLRLFINFN